MPRAFFSGTAEQLVAVVQAVAAKGPTDAAFVASFSSLNAQRTGSALGLAADLGFLAENAGTYSVSNPLALRLRTPQEREKAAIIRIALESYEPFRVFREELETTGDARRAARQTVVLLELAGDEEDVQTTLVNLATYSGALVAGPGGTYERDSKNISSMLLELAAGAGEEAAALFRIRTQLGNETANAISHDNVISPLVIALRHAAGDSPREAVVNAGNAVESFLSEFGNAKGVNLANAHGLNAKLDELKRANAISSKVQFNGKYLGHIRNAADHGVDPDVGSPWDISIDTGVNYVFVACTFIRTVLGVEGGRIEI